MPRVDARRLSLMLLSFALSGITAGSALRAQAPNGQPTPPNEEELRLRASVHNALDLARPALLDHLAEAAREATRPGELALIVLAALHDGITLDEPRLERAVDRLARGKPDQTYDLALRLMVLEACEDFPGRAELAADDVKTLLQHRYSRGTFQYGRRPGGWDLSNTQYGALGLRAGRALGITIDRDVFAKLGKEVAAQQDREGGFGYARHNGTGRVGYASMTSAGIAVLAICRQAAGGETFDRPIARAWQWFEQNEKTIGSLREHWCFYFHYGLERAAILCDVERVGGDVDWYARGARMLVDGQLPGGGWQSHEDGFPGHHLDRGRGDLVPTSFAVLFLRRRFQKEAGPLTHTVVTLANLGPHSRARDVAACAEALAQRGKAAMADIVKGLTSEIEPQRRAAATALVRVAGEDFGYDPARSAEDNRDAVRRAELWYLRHR